ncbi:MAG: type II toxin-antitoxin system RelE/ParE family toxin [Candidatus Anammoxibacter sp.]
MIKNFKNRALKHFYERGNDRRIRTDHIVQVKDILVRLDVSASPEDMNLPGFHLHRLRGNYKGFWAVTVRANWRIIFRFEDSDVVDVDYLDYH